MTKEAINKFEVGDRVRKPKVSPGGGEPQYDYGIIADWFVGNGNGWDGVYYKIWCPIEKRIICTTSETQIELVPKD